MRRLDYKATSGCAVVINADAVTHIVSEYDDGNGYATIHFIDGTKIAVQRSVPEVAADIFVDEQTLC